MYELQTNFKAATASTLGGGGVIPAEDIQIDTISAGSIDVAWHVAVPATVMTEVASLVTTMASAPAAISVPDPVTGNTVTASAMAAPTVYAEPDVDCVGEWTTCDESCSRFFDISVVASGSGQDCSYRCVYR